jgi:hypothetical protein
MGSLCKLLLKHRPTFALQSGLACSSHMLWSAARGDDYVPRMTAWLV